MNMEPRKCVVYQEFSKKYRLLGCLQRGVRGWCIHSLHGSEEFDQFPLVLQHLFISKASGRDFPTHVDFQAQGHFFVGLEPGSMEKYETTGPKVPASPSWYHHGLTPCIKCEKVMPWPNAPLTCIHLSRLGCCSDFRWLEWGRVETWTHTFNKKNTQKSKNLPGIPSIARWNTQLFGRAKNSLHQLALKPNWFLGCTNCSMKDCYRFLLPFYYYPRKFYVKANSLNPQNLSEPLHPGKLT